MIFAEKIKKIYKSQLFARCDDKGLAKYFSHKDFDGLSAYEYRFESSLGHELCGYFYSYEGCDKKRLIIFEHGFGGGHRSYMKEIERLCRAGHLVFAYDHTGCMESGGKSANGLAQSLCDLNDCIETLKDDQTVDTSDISVVGHSWGGYSTINIAALHPDVKRIVAISAPISVELMIEQNFSGPLKGYRKYIKALETEASGEFAAYNGIETLKNASTRALLIYSDDDRIIQKSTHYDALFAALNGRKGIEFLLEHGKGHNPNYTREAVGLLAQLARAAKKAAKYKTDAEREAFRNSFDWDGITEQDELVWNRITEFLK